MPRASFVLKTLKYQPVFEYYSKCSVPFENMKDLRVYHESCAQGGDYKGWPGIDVLIQVKNNSPEASAFKQMYTKLSNNRGDELTITIRQRSVSVQGKSMFYYDPTAYQDVFDFYAVCEVPFKNLSDLRYYHEKCVRFDADKQWPSLGVLMRVKNNSPEADAFRQLYTKMDNLPGALGEDYLTINIQPRSPMLPGMSLYEYIPVAPVLQKDDDMSLRIRKSVENKTHEITNFFKNKPDGYVPPVQKVFTVPVPPSVITISSDEQAKQHRKLGFYVYMITSPGAPSVKIGKHTGDLHQLRIRYNTSNLWGQYDIYAFPTANNILVEKGLHILLDSFELREIKNQEKFKDTPKTREIFFGTASIVSLKDT